MTLIKIDLRGKEVTVDKDEYITAKYEDLRIDFNSLTRDHVETLVNGMLEGKQFDGIIAAFISPDNPRSA